MSAADAPAFAAYRSEPAVARYQSWTAPYPLESAHRLIDEQPAEPTAGGWIQLAIEHDGQLVGDVAVGLSGDGKVATIGYTLSSAHQGSGLATEAVGAVVDRLFDELGRAPRRGLARPAQRRVRTGRRAARLRVRGHGRLIGVVRRRVDRRRPLRPDGRHPRCVARPVPPDPHRRPPGRGHPGQRARRCDACARTTARSAFVSPMAGSFADALAPEVYDGAPVVPWLRGIEADGEIVGFMMLAERTEHHQEAYLWRLLIDRRHQRRGIGWRALTTLIEQLRQDGHASLGVSWVPDRGGPEPMYRKLGFVPTGELDGTEVVGRAGPLVTSDRPRGQPLQLGEPGAAPPRRVRDRPPAGRPRGPVLRRRLRP